MQTSDVIHGSRGTSQIVVVVVATQELPDTVEIGSTVVMNKDVSGGNGGKDSEEVVNGGGPVGVIDTIEGESVVEEDETVEDGRIIEVEEGSVVEDSGDEDESDDDEESDDEEMLVLDGVWLAVLELPETDKEANVTVAAVN
jgi:hypothetical protein